MARRVFLVLSFVLLGTSGCGDEPTGSPSVRSIEIVGLGNTIELGTQVQLGAITKDFRGNELTGRPVTWSSTRPAIAKVTSSGMLTARTPGTTLVMAMSERRTDTLQLEVVVPVAALVVWAPSTMMAVGQVQSMSIVVRNAQNQVLTDFDVTWTSSSNDIVSVGSDGVVSAHSTGSARITATVGQHSAVADINVVNAPTIQSVSTSQIKPGDAVTITGSSFHPDLAEAAVTIGGVPAEIHSISPTSISITAPCTRSGEADVRVWRDGAYGPSVQVTVTAPQRALSLGESFVQPTSAASSCIELADSPTDALYLVMPFSVGKSAGVFATTQVYGVAGPPTAFTATRVEHDLSSRMQHASFAYSLATPHAGHLQSERTRYAELRGRLDTSAVAGYSQGAKPIEVGETRGFYITFAGGCADVSSVISARALHVGSHAVVWEDQSNTLRAEIDAGLATYYGRLATIYDSDQHDIVKNHFADPLLRDGKTDADGKVHLVFTERLNGSGVDAYTTVCDQFPRAGSTPASNVGQLIYVSVPTRSGSNINDARFPDGWFNLIARTIVHEVKHVASFSARLENGAIDWEEVWLEEATARIAEELWVRSAVHKVAAQSNSGWGLPSSNGVYCDFHPVDAACNAADGLRRPGYGMRRHFNEILPKLVDPWNFSPYGDPAGQQGVFYNTAWSLVRYAADRYGSSDAEFFRALTNASNGGMENLLDKVGVPESQLLGGWGLALFADDYPGLPQENRDIRFSTWNLRSIYAGLNAAPMWSGRFENEYPVQPVQLPSGAFVADAVHMRGAAHMYYLLVAPHGMPAAVGLRSTGENAGNVRVAIVRLR